jgi:hypothetical protein
MRILPSRLKRIAKRNSNSPKGKDAWDKAQIISGFASSIVLATVGIVINDSIQRAQLKASKAASDAQIEVTRTNNEAQLALAKENSETQKHVQESTITAQLMDSLTGRLPLEKADCYYRVETICS